MQAVLLVATDRATDCLPWVIVENAGACLEGVWGEYDTFKAALEDMKNCGGRDEGFDLMKRLPDHGILKCGVSISLLELVASLKVRALLVRM